MFEGCQRCLRIKPTDMINDPNAAALTAPFAHLRDILRQAVLGMSDVKAEFKNGDTSEIEKMIILVQKMVSMGYLEPFGQILGTLKVSLGIITLNIKRASEGISNWEQAEKDGDLGAGYLAAFIKLHPERVAHKGFLVNAPSIGIAKLNALAQRGHIPACKFLGQWYSQNGDVVAAMKHYKQMFLNAPGSIDGAVGFLESISREYAKSSEDDRKLIKQALEVVQSSNAVHGALYAGYLRIVKKHEGISDEQALDYIISMAANRVCEDTNAFEFLKETQFLKKFEAWLAPFESKKNPASNSFMAKAYLSHAILLYTNSALSRSFDPYPLALVECNKALKLNPDLIEAEALQATIHYINGTKGNDPATIAQMKISIMRCCKKLQERHLTLDAIPILDNLIKLIRLNGATPGSLKTNHTVITIDTIKGNILDREWAEAIAKKFEAKPAQA
jgi:tetratricopeptide (TPR) repeat protein